jgi:ankyrin repeat protein
MKGVGAGFNQLHLTLIVSLTGDVSDAEASGDDRSMKFWPKLRDKVYHWKYVPFEKEGKAVTAEVEEYIDLVPPEKLPKIHIAPPRLNEDSKVKITLSRSGCFGSCPSYKVAVSTEGITFDGGGYVVAKGQHSEGVSADQVRELARKFVDADFYSMNDEYTAGVTDCPTYVLAIDIDGRTKQVVDYVGAWEGMPAVITDLENEVDKFARTERWIKGGEGLVSQLQGERFNFQSYEGQLLLKEAATRGEANTVQELLFAGVSLVPLKAPKPKKEYYGIPFEHQGWLNVAASHPEVLRVLLAAGASKADQADKDLALANAANAGRLDGVRSLIEYGANPNADLSKLVFTREGAGMTMSGAGAGSVLIYAAASGNPEVVREILRYKPNLEARDGHGKTAIFAAADYRYNDVEGARVQCVRLLAGAGANVNARDNDGNTPLHESFLTDVEEELLRLGADVNAQNNDGQTPIFTNVDDDCVELFVAHGADLTIRDKEGRTVFEATENKGPKRLEALRKVAAEQKK